jgi:hypothetical protein
MDPVCDDPMLPGLNEPSGGTRRRHKKSQIEARASVHVGETEDAGGTAGTLGIEALGNSKLTATADQQLATFKTHAPPVLVK